MGFRNPIVVADQISSGNFAGNYTIGGSFVVGNPAASHAVVGTDAHGADGFRLYGSDGVTPLIDLNISTTPTITGAHIQTAATGSRVELSTTSASLINLYSGSASETSPGTIGTTIIGTELITQVKAPVTGSQSPPTLQLWTGSSGQAAQLNSPSGQTSLQSQGWTVTLDGAFTNGGTQAATPELLTERITIRQNSTPPYNYLRFVDGFGTPFNEKGFVGSVPVASTWYTGAQAGDLILQSESGSQRVVALSNLAVSLGGAQGPGLAHLETGNAAGDLGSYGILIKTAVGQSAPALSVRKQDGTGDQAWISGDGAIFTNNFVEFGDGSLRQIRLWGINGAPPAGLGSVGDFAMRWDTPGTANQRIYLKNLSNVWVGIL